jgi:hypothetical protein
MFFAYTLTDYFMKRGGKKMNNFTERVLLLQTATTTAVATVK